MVDSALQHVNNVVFSTSLEESQKCYSAWSKSYDDDVQQLGSNTPIATANMFKKYGMKAKMVLDLGGGTGKVVELIRNFGFEGTVDILDASIDMLQLGEKKQIKLRNIIRHYVQEDGILPLKDEAYDVVTSAGSFIPNHIPTTALKGILNVIKKEGLFILTTRSKSTETYKVNFDRVLNELISSGKVKLLEEQEFLHFDKLEEITSAVYVLKRLR